MTGLILKLPGSAPNSRGADSATPRPSAGQSLHGSLSAPAANISNGRGIPAAESSTRVSAFDKILTSQLEPAPVAKGKGESNTTSDIREPSSDSAVESSPLAPLPGSATIQRPTPGLGLQSLLLGLNEPLEPADTEPADATQLAATETGSLPSLVIDNAGNSQGSVSQATTQPAHIFAPAGTSPSGTPAPVLDQGQNRSAVPASNAWDRVHGQGGTTLPLAITNSTQTPPLACWDGTYQPSSIRTSGNNPASGQPIPESPSPKQIAASSLASSAKQTTPGLGSSDSLNIADTQGLPAAEALEVDAGPHASDASSAGQRNRNPGTAAHPAGSAAVRPVWEQGSPAARAEPTSGSAAIGPDFSIAEPPVSQSRQNAAAAANGHRNSSIASRATATPGHFQGPALAPAADILSAPAAQPSQVAASTPPISALPFPTRSSAQSGSNTPEVATANATATATHEVDLDSGIIRSELQPAAQGMAGPVVAGNKQIAATESQAAAVEPALAAHSIGISEANPNNETGPALQNSPQESFDVQAVDTQITDPSNSNPELDSPTVAGGTSGQPLSAAGFEHSLTGAPQEFNDRLQQVIDRIEIDSAFRTQQARSTPQTRIQLAIDPPELGPVEIQIAQRGRELVAEITATNPLAQQRLQSDLGTLRQTLESLGVQVNDIELEPAVLDRQRFAALDGALPSQAQTLEANSPSRNAERESGQGQSSQHNSGDSSHSDSSEERGRDRSGGNQNGQGSFGSAEGDARQQHQPEQQQAPDPWPADERPLPTGNLRLAFRRMRVWGPGLA